MGGGAGRGSSYLAHIRITIIRKVDTKANKCAYVDVVVGQGTRITSWETVPLRAQRFSLFSRTHFYIHWGRGGGLGVDNRHQHLDQEWENSKAGGGRGATPSLFSTIVLALGDC